MPPTNTTAGIVYLRGGLISAQTSLGNLYLLSAGNTTVTGIDNIGAGRGALAALTTGGYNIGIGLDACAAVTTASGNIGIGKGALKFATGADSVAIGNEAAGNIGSQGGNVYVGANAGQQSTTNSGNVGIGKFALNANTAGIQNTALGRASLMDLNITVATDGNNTAIGFDTGRGIVTGKNNTILGANVTGLAADLIGHVIIADGAGTIRLRHDATSWILAPTVATPAGGSTAARLAFGSTAGFGIYIGSGAPTVTAAQGSLYLRSDGSTTSTRAYINTNGATTWTAITTAA